MNNAQGRPIGDLRACRPMMLPKVDNSADQALQGHPIVMMQFSGARLEPSLQSRCDLHRPSGLGKQS
jgi:hypothetical protein